MTISNMNNNASDMYVIKTEIADRPQDINQILKHHKVEVDQL